MCREIEILFCMYVSTCVCMYVHVYVYVYACMYVRTCVYMYVCMFSDRYITRVTADITHTRIEKTAVFRHIKDSVQLLIHV